MNTNDKLTHYLKDNVALEDCRALSWLSTNFNDKRCEFNMLSAIGSKKMSGSILRLTKEFLKNLSIEELTAYVNETNFVGENIFFFCCNIELMKIIIKYGNINARSYIGNNALMEICNYRHSKSFDIQIVELLLDNGIDINATDNNGCTALVNYCSVHRPTAYHPNDNFENVIELLISRGADVLLRTNQRFQAFDYVQPALISEECAQLLRGEIYLNCPKSAAKI